MAAAKAMDLAVTLGKTPLLLRKECHGFVVNRVMMAIEREAFRLVEEGIASPSEIDTAIKCGLNHPMGPFRLADLIGLDLLFDALRDGGGQSHGDNTEPRAGKVPEFIEEMYHAGRLGRRTGAGFYDY